MDGDSHFNYCENAGCNLIKEIRIYYETEGTGLKNIRVRLMLNYNWEAEFMSATTETGGFRVLMRFQTVMDGKSS